MKDKKWNNSFSTLETKLVMEWYGSSIESILEKEKEKIGENATEEYLICLLHEKLQTMVNHELAFIPNGFIYDVIKGSFQHIDYQEIVRYFNQ